MTNIYGLNQRGYFELHPPKIRSFSKVDHLNLYNKATNNAAYSNLSWNEFNYTYAEEDNIWDEDYLDDYF